MKKALKAGGAILVGVLVLTLFTLRVTGLEPQYIEPRGEAWIKSGMTARPGLWLKGEVVTTPITDWSFVNAIHDPIRKNTIMVETRTWYGIPHSVTTGVVARGDKLYVHAHSDDRRLATAVFPYDKAWTTNVSRDPRVRLKIGGKLYEMTLVLIPDRVEVAAIGGRDPIEREKGPDGQERVSAIMHWYRAFQRNIPEYGSAGERYQKSARENIGFDRPGSR